MKSKSTAAERRDRASNEEIEFMEAMERYKHENRRPFPTWPEVLEVLRSLGYTKEKAAGKRSHDSAKWGHVCNELREERDQLLLKVAECQQERDDYLKALYALTWENLDVDKKAILAQLGRKPSLEDVISELESGERE